MGRECFQGNTLKGDKETGFMGDQEPELDDLPQAGGEETSRSTTADADTESEAITVPEEIKHPLEPNGTVWRSSRIRIRLIVGLSC